MVEPEPSGSEVTVVAAAGVFDGPLVNVNVKFGKAVIPLMINVGAGVPPILDQLARVTKVPVSSQTLLGPGGRKWTVASDLSTLRVKEGMKLTLIGKVPPGWRALEAIEKGKPPRQLWCRFSSPTKRYSPKFLTRPVVPVRLQPLCRSVSKLRPSHRRQRRRPKVWGWKSSSPSCCCS